MTSLIMRPLDGLYQYTDRMSRLMARLAGALLLLSAIVITADVLLRKLFDFSLGGSDELAGYALAISTSWGLPYALLRRANIRIDFIYLRLPPRLTAWLDLAGLVAMAGFMVFVTWFAGALWLDSIEMGATANTPLETPLMIPQGIWVMGLVLFLLALAVLMARVLALLVRGDAEGVSRDAGIRTVEEEVRDEVGDALVRLAPDTAAAAAPATARDHVSDAKNAA